MGDKQPKIPRTPDFATWQSRMANSIEDKSTFLRSVCSHSEMQVRSMFASLNVPAIRTEDDALAWLSCFCTERTGSGAAKAQTKDVIGVLKTRDWYETLDAIQWVLEFKRQITNGWAPE